MTSKRLIHSRRFRFVISCLLLVHLSAVFLPPLSFQTRGPVGQSPSVSTLIRPLEGYGQFLYIDRGYAFFAPDPGPSHLIQVALTDPSGERREVMYPNLREQWPRLLYHRHFMLSEFLYEIYEPPLSPSVISSLDQIELESWRRSRSRYQQFRESIIHHLETVHPEHQVAIRRIEHLIPDLLQFREQPVPLDLEESYRVLLDQALELEDANPEAPPGPTTDSYPNDGAALPGKGLQDFRRAVGPRVNDGQPFDATVGAAE